MSSTASSQALPFDIQVLDGPLSQQTLMTGLDVGLIRLTGRALPYRPISFEGKQRVKTTFYAGNTVATQQVMGPIEEPTVINGTWKDKYLGNGQARAMVALFDKVRRSGALLQVTWGAGLVSAEVGGVFFQRKGILSRFKFTPERPQDVAWEAQFDWNGQGEQVAPMVSASSASNQREGFEKLRNGLAQMNDDVESFLGNSRLTRAIAFAQEIDNAVVVTTEGITDVINQFGNAALGAVSVADTPAAAIERGINVAGRMADLCKFTVLTLIGNVTDDVEAVEDLAERLGIPADATGFLEPTLFPRDSAVDVLVFGGNRLHTAQEATRRQEDAMDNIATLQGQLLPEDIGQERPPVGTDLRDLAAKWYGDPDLWWIIARHNNIVGSRVPDRPSGPSDDPGHPIAIPRRPSGDLADLRRQC